MTEPAKPKRKSLKLEGKDIPPELRFVYRVETGFMGDMPKLHKLTVARISPLLVWVRDEYNSVRQHDRLAQHYTAGDALNAFAKRKRWEILRDRTEIRHDERELAWAERLLAHPKYR